MDETFSPYADSVELNTALFESTFLIEQVDQEGRRIFGTTFVLVRPCEDEPTLGRPVLITAKHVLEKMMGDDATWYLRIKDNGGQWRSSPVQLKIRINGEPNWVTHPTQDVAAMYVQLKDCVLDSPLPIHMLANDQGLARFEIHPGDELNCLGFPQGMSANAARFPLLRSGKIASYPLYPSKDHPTFLYDFEVFPGNSGGPVYMVESNRNYDGGIHFSKIQFVAGLVTEQYFTDDDCTERLALSAVVSGSAIREAISMLPDSFLGSNAVSGETPR